MKNSTNLFYLAMAITGIVLYQFYGLMASMIAAISMMSAWVVGHKVAGKPVDRIMYLQLGLMLLLGIPAIVLNKGIFYKIGDPISGFLCAFGLLTAKRFMAEPVIKSFIPSGWLNSTTENAWLPKITDETWHKIDYIMAAQMIVSAAINLTIALTLPTYIWYYCSFVIGPVTSALGFYAMYRQAKPDIEAGRNALNVTAGHSFPDISYQELPSNDPDHTPVPAAAPAENLVIPERKNCFGF